MKVSSEQEANQDTAINSEQESNQALIIDSEIAMLKFGQDFARQLKSNNNLNAVIELIGDVGAGKTTFVRGLAAGLGIQKPITSPSFTISKSYVFQSNDNLINNSHKASTFSDKAQASATNQTLHTLTHYDFYRLADPGLMAEDLQEKINNHHLTLVEWGNTITDILPANRIKINITLNNDNTRNLTISQKNLNPNSKNHSPAPKNHHLTKTPQNSKITSVYLDTSTPTTILIISGKIYTWESKNELAEKLLQFIHDKLRENHQTWTDIAEITFMSGPGSFTGLRIGASIVNTLAHDLNIPLYDHHGKQHNIILPDYGRAANISKPRK